MGIPIFKSIFTDMGFKIVKKPDQLRTGLASEEGDENFLNIISIALPKLLFPVLRLVFHTPIIPEASY